MPHSEQLHYGCKNRIARLTLCRPHQHNALSDKLVDALGTAFEQATETTSAKVILLQAEGSSFCAGADLSDLRRMQQQTFEENLKHSNKLRVLFQQIYTCPKPVVAKVQGPALAGGCGLVAVCDLVLASEAATFACPEVRIGFVPAIITQFLLRRIGEAHTKALVLSGERITATKAAQIGLISSHHPLEALDEAVSQLLQSLVEKNSAYAMQTSKRLLYRLQQLPFEEGLQSATDVNASARASEDCQLGIQRFLEKSPQDWHKR